MNPRRTAPELIDLVLDDGSFESWDSPVSIEHWPDTYRAELRAARERTGVDESVLTGSGTVRGRRVAVIVNEFRFLAGSIGAAAAGRIVAAVTRATAEGLPILASTASGGTRMQEGTPAFVQMVEISRALMAHRAAGLPYLVHLRHPTTGGVYASWGSLGHITVAEPGALVGFLGPKVYGALAGREFPAGVQTAENLAAKGVIDAVVDAVDLPELVDAALAVLVDPPAPTPSPPEEASPSVVEEARTADPSVVEEARTADPPVVEEARSAVSKPPHPDRTAWQVIEASRAPTRAGVRDLLRVAGASTVRLKGTDEGERDDTVLIALTRLAGQPCVVVGQDRSRQSPATPMGPGALREARRGMRLAEELRLPLVTIVDTPGAELSPSAEEGAIAGEIARCIGTLVSLTVPTVSVILGQGCGGGALALLPARTVLAGENGWLSPLPPEGASVIVHGVPDHAAEMAAKQQVRAVDLLAAGIITAIIAETDQPDGYAAAAGAAIAQAIAAQRS